MSEFLELTEDLKTAVDQLNQVLQGDENTTVMIDGEEKPSVQKKTLDTVNAQVQLVLDAAADIDSVKYQTAAAGIAATTDGQFFSVVSSNDDSYLELYKNVAGVAELRKTYPTNEYIDNAMGGLTGQSLMVDTIKNGNSPENSTSSLGSSPGVYVLKTAASGDMVVDKLLLHVKRTGQIRLHNIESSGNEYHSMNYIDVEVKYLGFNKLTRMDTFGFIVADGNYLGVEVIADEALITYSATTGGEAYAYASELNESDSFTDSAFRDVEIDFSYTLANYLSLSLLENELKSKTSMLSDLNSKTELLEPLSTTIGNPLETNIGSEAFSGAMFFKNSVVSTSYLKEININASSAGSLGLYVLKKEAGNYSVLSLKTLIVQTIGLVTLTEDDFGVITVDTDTYLGIGTGGCKPTTSDVIGAEYYKGAIHDNIFVPNSTASNKVDVNFGLLTPANNSLLNKLPPRIDSLEFHASNEGINSAIMGKNTLPNLEKGTLGYFKTIGAQSELTEETATFSANAQLIIDNPIPSNGEVIEIEVFSGTGGVIEVGTYRTTESTSEITRLTSFNVNLSQGFNKIALDLPVKAGNYIGIKTTAVGQVASHTRAGWSDDPLFITGNGNPVAKGDSRIGFSFQFRFLIKGLINLAEDTVTKPWAGKKMANFGDSITWYDGQVFASSHRERGQVVKGYQHYAREALGCETVNYGVSGSTLPELWLSRISVANLTGVDICTFTSGANDHRKGVDVGIVKDIGASFDVTTFAGALQSSIEHVINVNTAIRIFLMTPIRGYYFESGTSAVPGPYKDEMELSRDYVDCMIAIAELYGLPLLNWYDNLGVNELNFEELYGDDITRFTSYRLHPTNHTFSVMGSLFHEFLLSGK